MRVEERKRPGGRLVIRLDRPVPRGTPLQIRREELSEPAEGEYYVFDARHYPFESLWGLFDSMRVELVADVFSAVTKLVHGFFDQRKQLTSQRKLRASV